MGAFFSCLSRHEWDRAFLYMVPVIAMAAAVGLFFGNPIDNLIVIAWIVPLWLFARYCGQRIHTASSNSDLS